MDATVPQDTTRTATASEYSDRLCFAPELFLWKFCDRKQALLGTRPHCTKSIETCIKVESRTENIAANFASIKNKKHISTQQHCKK